jgi:hypothetical protein
MFRTLLVHHQGVHQLLLHKTINNILVSCVCRTDGNFFSFSYRESVKLRQVTDGTHFIQLIYGADNDIKDCEFLSQKKIVRDFLDTFRKDVERAKVSSNSDNDYSATEDKTEDTYSFRNVTFQILDNGVPLSSDVSKWLDFEDLKQRCRENHREMKRLLRHKKHGTEEQKRDASNHLERFVVQPTLGLILYAGDCLKTHA